MTNTLHVVDTEQQSALKYSEVFIKGDLTRLTPAERLEYYITVCSTVGLNPATRPLEFLELPDGKGGKKTVLYARKDCTDQLRDLKCVSISLQPPQYADGLCIVIAVATMPSGKQDMDMGITTIGELKADFRANAIMKAVTKAKRRVTLSICGLGMLDETEVETIPDARPLNMNMETGALELPTTQEEPQQEEAKPQPTTAELFREKSHTFGFQYDSNDGLRHLCKLLLGREPERKHDYKDCLAASDAMWKACVEQATQDVLDAHTPAPTPLVEMPPTDNNSAATVGAMSR